MPEKIESGEFGPLKEKIKSPEELRFERLSEDARDRSIEGNYPYDGAPEELEEIYQNSLRGGYWDSGDPEKMAVFKLEEIKSKINLLIVPLYILETWDEHKQKESYLEQAKNFVIGAKKNFWEKKKEDRIAELQPILSEIGVSVPQTVEEVKDLRNSIISFENFRKLIEKYKAESR